MLIAVRHHQEQEHEMLNTIKDEYYRFISGGCHGCNAKAKFISGVLKKFKEIPSESKTILMVSTLNDQIKDQETMLKTNEEKLKLRDETIDKMEKDYKEFHAQQDQLISKLIEEKEQL